MGSKLDEENTIIQRVRDVIYANGRSITQFASSIGVGQTTLNQQLVVGKISSVTLESILKNYPDISAEWLMRGTGTMIKGADNQDFACMQDELESLRKERDKLAAQVELLNKVIEKLVK